MFGIFFPCLLQLKGSRTLSKLSPEISVPFVTVSKRSEVWSNGKRPSFLHFFTNRRLQKLERRETSRFTCMGVWLNLSFS